MVAFFICFAVLFFILIVIIMRQDDTIAKLSTENDLIKGRIESMQASDYCPLILDDINAAVQMIGHDIEKAETWIRFMVENDTFIIDTSRLPQIIILRDYLVKTSEWDMDLLKHAAHILSDEMILVKAIFLEEENDESLRFLVVAMDRNPNSFRDNIRAYLGVIQDGARRLNEIYRELEKDKQSSLALNHLVPVSQQDPKLLS